MFSTLSSPMATLSFFDEDGYAILDDGEVVFEDEDGNLHAIKGSHNDGWLYYEHAEEEEWHQTYDDAMEDCTYDFEEVPSDLIIEAFVEDDTYDSEEVPNGLTTEGIGQDGETLDAHCGFVERSADSADWETGSQDDFGFTALTP